MPVPLPSTIFSPTPTPTTLESGLVATAALNTRMPLAAAGVLESRRRDHSCLAAFKSDSLTVEAATQGRALPPPPPPPPPPRVISCALLMTISSVVHDEHAPDPTATRGRRGGRVIAALSPPCAPVGK